MPVVANKQIIAVVNCSTAISPVAILAIPPEIICLPKKTQVPKTLVWRA